MGCTEMSRLGPLREPALSCGHGLTCNTGSAVRVTSGYDAVAPTDDDEAVSLLDPSADVAHGPGWSMC